MDAEQVGTISPVVRSKQYQLINQKVELDIDFDQRIKGTTYLTIFPEHPDIKAVVLNARQCQIHNVTINGLKPESVDYADPCDTLTLHTNASVKQHHILQEKLSGSLSAPPQPELIILLPDELEITETPEFVVQTAAGVKAAKLTGNIANDAEVAESLADTAVSRYTPLSVVISFTSTHTRDALHFACGSPGSGRWPHVYTRGGFLPGRASVLFPCMDSLYYRCTWEISLTGPKTVGDALRQISGLSRPDDQASDDTRAYEAKEMVYVCPGELTDDIVSKTNPSRRTVSWNISQNVSAQHIGFAIGPFEKLDLGTFRDAEKLELLQENAAPINGYCLPGRTAEVENTCLATTDALDHFSITHAPYPFHSFSYCFVDDNFDRPANFAGLAVCSSRMLHPENVIDTAQEVTRTLVQALTTQWLGIQILPKLPEDTWVVLGSALFLADVYMRDLCGNNEYRFRMKKMADRVCQLDHERPSLSDMGALLHVDPAEYDFLALKSPLVLYILDRRIHKTVGSPKMSINIGKFMSKARNEDLKDNLLSTQDFCKVTEKVLHASIDDFINQWVKGAGCPQFAASQKFNKKKLVIEMTIRQTQATNTAEHELEPDKFMRDVREDFQTVYAAPQQHVFTGPMTIRIHEADGTPYEHIIQIKEAITKVEVPYNTKYKRLKRGKKQRAKNAARADGDEENDALVYCLGDVLQTDEEISAWKITEWSEEDEARMNAESYEWIRLDADFEWISTIRLGMAGHMFVSQLQQDRDVAAQLVSIQHISEYSASQLVSSILLRTMMDSRYFHGIRTAAAHALVKHASNDNDIDMIGLFHLRKAFEELYCVSEGDSIMTRPNDFSDQLSYFLQCAIVEAISRVRDENGYTPYEVKVFLLDKLKFNDNSQNSVSDAYYVSVLIKALSNALLARPKRPSEEDLEDDLDAATHWAGVQAFEKSCLDEIDRYRRMDEWTSSYQNLYSRTALESQSKLAKAGLADFSLPHFLQYTRLGNFDMLRCAAFDALASDDLFTESNKIILRYFVHCMAAEPSPWLRYKLRQAFGKSLARKALGFSKVVSGVVQSDTLLVEGAPVATAVGTDEARRTSVEGALNALKNEIGSHEALQKYLWQALNHPDVGYEDVKALLEFCQMIYPAEDHAIVAIRLPRYWKMDIVGKGKLRFRKSNKIRTKKFEAWKPKITIPLSKAPPAPAVRTGIKLKIGSNKQGSFSIPSPAAVATPTPTPPPPQSVTAPAPASVSTPAPAQPQRQVLKLKLKPGAKPLK